MSNEKQINVGLIGCGGRAKYILRNMPDLGTKIKLTSLCDISEGALERYRETFAPDAKLYTNYKEMLADPAIDWVMVVTPNWLHKEHACAAFEAGKNVFCEKPLAISVEDCLAIKQAYEKSGKQFMIGFTLRFSPHYRKIKKLLDSKVIGEIISLEANETIAFNHGGHVHSGWRRFAHNSGGHIMEKCSHDLDMLNYLINSKPSRVVSFGGKNFFIPENEYHMARLKTDESTPYCTWWNPWEERVNPFKSQSTVVDNQVAILEYENNVRVTFHANCNAGILERRLYICGTEGSLRADVITGEIEVKRIGYHEESKDESAHGEKGGHGGGDEVLGKELCDYILRDAKPATCIDDGITSAFIAMGIEESRHTNSIIDMNTYWDKMKTQPAV